MRMRGRERQQRRDEQTCQTTDESGDGEGDPAGHERVDGVLSLDLPVSNVISIVQGASSLGTPTQAGRSSRITGSASGTVSIQHSVSTV